MKIIGLSGRKQSGKDSLFGLLKESLPDLKVERVAFADALKQEVAHACGVTVEQIEREKSRWRGLLQHWGTEFRRHDNESYWIDRARDKIEAMRGCGADVAVITDVRFENEASMVRDMGGLLVRIVRNQPSQSDSHPSETAMDNQPYDITIDNTGTLDALRSNVQLLARIIQLSSSQ